MRKETRFKFNAYLSRVAELNGVETDDVAKKFTVEPSVTQTLMNTLQVSSAFLTKINIVPVDELKGEKVGVGVNGTIASTADTAGDNERKTADFTALESNKYECAQINFDFHIRYKQLDLWARFQDFQTRIRDAIIKRQSLDFIMAGFNGIERAERREQTITRLLNENEDLRRWYRADLPDAVRRLHTRTACASAGHCLQRLPESEPLPDAGKRAAQ